MGEAMGEESIQQRVERYMARAQRVLRTGYLALEDGDYTTAQFVARIEAALREMGALR
jgi:hypothetical protein